MNKNYIHIIILVWCGLLWANPASSAIGNGLEFYRVSVTISKDTINPIEKDTTKTKKVDQAPASGSRTKKIITSASVTLVPTTVRNYKSEEI